MALPAPPRRPRDLAIDCMRGVAILLVVVYHAGPLAWRMPPYDDNGLLHPPHLGLWWLAVPFLHFGYAGVHLFFVLSGYCIHASCRLGRDLYPLDATSARRYALRRLLRIAPPYWLALLLFGVVVPRIAMALGRSGTVAAGWDLAVHALFLHGLSPRSIFSIDPAFWSLATEMQFYAAYPLVAWAISRLGVRDVLAGALCLSLAWRAMVIAAWPPTAEHFLIYRVWLHGFFVPRWFEWILGCWLAEAMVFDGGLAITVRKRAAAIGGVVMLGLAVLCRIHVVIDKLFADLLLSTGFVLLLAYFLGRERGLPMIPTAPPWLGARVLAAIGRRSYGTYLVHQPILDSTFSLGGLQLGPRLVLAAGVSAVFSLLCERPFERLSQRVRRKPQPPPEALELPG